jgi:precorrin-2/cobalt-factor-2 C20-methyltransferase
LIERGTMPGQKVQRLVDAGESVPYFSIAVVHGQGRRP